MLSYGASDATLRRAISVRIWLACGAEKSKPPALACTMWLRPN
jgi:hypothetical protein